jgi:hypothetical protein
MKNRIKLITAAITLFCLVLAGVTSEAQPTVTVNFNGTGLAPGTIYVPVVLNGTGVGTYQWIINYDRDVLTYVNHVDNVPGGNFMSVTNNYTNANLPGGITVPYLKISFSWFGGSPGYDYSTQAVTTLQFTYNGGVTTLPFVNIATTTAQTAPYFTYTATYPGGSGGTINLGTVYTGGSASGPYVALHSKATGGPFQWNSASSWVEAKIPSHAYDVFITGDEVQIPVAAKCNNLTINSAGKLTLNSGQTLAVAGNFLSLSNASNTGSYVDLGTTTVTGTTSVQRYMSGNWDGNWPTSTITWHYVSSPVSGGTINSFLGGLLNYWDEPSNLWVAQYWPVTNPLVVDKGYSAAMTSNSVITFTGGSLNTGSQTYNGLTNADASSARGFNLIGNAYASAVKWDASVALSNVDGAAYLWSGTTYVSYLQSDVYQIPAEQGFYVHVTTGQNSGFLVIPNTNRVHSSNVYVKSSKNEQMSLKVDGNNMEDATSIRFNSEATEGFDPQYDAYKLWGVNACPQIYSIITGENLSINSLPELTTATVIPVGFKIGVNDTYTITASGLETFPAGTDIYLEDLFLGVTQNLNINPVYTFAATTGSPAHRFDIHFSPTTGIPQGTMSNIRIYSSDNNVYVNIPMDLHGEIFVYDLLGKEMARQPIQGNTLNKVSLNVMTGYYLVKVLGDKSTVSGKVFIR